MVPQHPLGLGRTEGVENFKPESDVTGEFNRFAQQRGRVGVQITPWTGINRRTGEVICGRVGDVQIDIEVGWGNFNQHKQHVSGTGPDARYLRLDANPILCDAKAMRILAFDTTMNACAVALWTDGDVVAQRVEAMTHGQAEALLPAIESTLAAAGVTYADLDRIAVTTGPGSFTGVRVGLATARGLGLAAGLPVIGIGTAEVLAAHVRRTEGPADVTIVIDARRADVYTQRFDTQGLPLTDAACVLPAAVTADGNALLAGDAVARVAAQWPSPPRTLELSYADPVDLAALAAARPAEGPPPAPLYVRPPDAAVPRNGGRLRP